MRKKILIAIVAVLAMASCSPDYLDREPQGGTLTQEQFDRLDASKLEGTLMGLYSMLYEDGSSSHDVFGMRSIDLWFDIASGDIAVTDKKYGWLYSDEQMRSATTRNSYLWSYYYQLIHNCNTVVKSINGSCDLMQKISDYGFPNEMTKEEAAEVFNAQDSTYARYLAQALALRGYSYSRLARFFTPVIGCVYMTGYNIKTYKCAPIYDENNMTSPQGLSTSEQVYSFGQNDLSNSVSLFESFGIQGRSSKLVIDVNVARGLASYAYLTDANYYQDLDNDVMIDHYKKAFEYASDVITSGDYQVIPNKELLTNGFNNINDKSWMWGLDVVTENRGALKSWFGQVDIHCYSYAWSGDTKVIDDILYGQIPDWDGRGRWFNDGEKKSAYKGCPDGKFFSAKNPNSTHTDSIDREWLNDDVYMRYESMFMMQAEAAYFLYKATSDNNYKDAAITALRGIMDERMNDENPYAATEYASYLASFSNDDELRKALIYNWRIEMWGEGFGYETFRRLTGKITRGGSHDYGAGSEVENTKPEFNMNMPSSETTYNPNI